MNIREEYKKILDKIRSVCINFDTTDHIRQSNENS